MTAKGRENWGETNSELRQWDMRISDNKGEIIGATKTVN